MVLTILWRNVRIKRCGTKHFSWSGISRTLDETTKEGAGSLYWDAEVMREVSDGYKLGHRNYKDPFEDLSQFPFKDENRGWQCH